MMPMASMPGYTPSEEMLNTLTHAVGIVLSWIALVALVQNGRQSKDNFKLVGNIVFGISLIILYTASTVYHGCPAGPLKKIFRYGDHISIYFLIAGSYTPLCLTFLRHTCGWFLFSTVWALAAAGITMKILFFDGFMKFSLMLFIAMGWLIIFTFRDMKKCCSVEFIKWLVYGGIIYTAGCYFFQHDEEYRYFHAIWHLFTLGGSICHFEAVMNLKGSSDDEKKKPEVD